MTKSVTKEPSLCHIPGERWIDMEHFDPYGTGPDMWGVMWTNRGPNPMVDGNMVAKGFKLFESMEDWQDHVKFLSAIS